jgi:hypothetical protein
MTPATHHRVRAAVLALPERERPPHLAALWCLLLLLEHCVDCREPRGFVAGSRAYRVPALCWAAQLLEHAWIECTAPDCTEPNHVTLISEPIDASAGIGR